MWQLSWSHPKFGSLLASCGFDHKIIIWKEYLRNDWKQSKVFLNHTSSVNSLQWAPLENMLILAACSADGTFSVI